MSITDEASKTIIFTEDEIQTIRHLIGDWGFEYSLDADREKVKALAEKLQTRHNI